MVDLTRDLERVAHVPGVLQRRALMVGCNDHATQELLNAEPHAAVAADPSLLIHDFAALSDAWRAVEPLLTTLTAALQFVSRCVFSKNGDNRAKHLADQADVFVTAAAMGECELLCLLMEASDAPWDDMTIDFAMLVELAALNGHRELVTWLWMVTTNPDVRVSKIRSLRIVGLARDALTAGAKRAYETLTQKQDEENTEMLDHLEKLFKGLCGPRVKAPATKPHVSSLETNESTISDKPITTDSDQLTVEMRVLTSRSLLSVVGAFQASPFAVVIPLMEQFTTLQRSRCGPPAPMAVARLAIIYGDLYVFKAACLVAKVRPVDLPLLLHFAVCEGRLEMVQWIHSQFGASTKCRADTMAMAVRCGWPQIVEWLHLHCPESAQSMSEHALNDAARWGHVTVLRVCHTYRLGHCTPGLIAKAVGAGQLEVVKLLYSLQWGYDRTVAMAEAFKYGRLDIVRWLYTEEAVATGRLVEALCSNASTAETTVRYLWSLIDPTSDLVTRCVVGSFGDICAKAATTTVAMVLPLVAPDSETAYKGLMAATRAKRQANVERLLRHWQPREPHRVDVLLKAALDTANVPLIKWLIQSECIPSTNLDALFTYAADKHTARLHSILNSCGRYASLKNIEMVDFALAAMKEIHTRKRREQGTQEAPLDQSGAVVERALLAAVPARARPKLVTYLIRHCRALDQGDIEFSRVLTLANGIVVLEHEEEDVDGVPVEGQIVVRFARFLPGGPVSPFCGVHAACTGNMGVLKFLHDQRLLVPFVVEAMVALAHAHNQLAVLRWFVSLGESIASEQGIRSTMEFGHRAIISYLIDLGDDRVDSAIERVLLEELKADVVHHTESTRRSNKRKTNHSKALGWAMSLLLLLQRQRPSHQEKLLEIAAEAGSLAAVQHMLGPLSTLDWTVVSLPQMLVAAAQGQNEAILKMFYERKTEEATNSLAIASLRQVGGLASVGAVETLLVFLSKWDPDVRGQLEKEQRDARVVFSLVTITTPRETPRQTQSRGRSRRQRQRPRHKNDQLAHKQCICGAPAAVLSPE